MLKNIQTQSKNADKVGEKLSNTYVNSPNATQTIPVCATSSVSESTAQETKCICPMGKINKHSMVDKYKKFWCE